MFGIAAQYQVAKLREDERFSGADVLRDLPVPSTRGIRNPTRMLRQRGTKNYLATWISSISPARCKLTAQGPLELFQDLLWAAADRYLMGDSRDLVVVPDRPAFRPISGKLHLGGCPRCTRPCAWRSPTTRPPDRRG